MSTFYDNFELICKANNTSPSGACIAIGMSKNTSHYWKKHNAIPKSSQLESLAKLLHVSVEDFFSPNIDAISVLNKVKENGADLQKSKITASKRSAKNEKDIETYTEEFKRIYSNLNTRQRTALMLLIYDFDETIRNSKEKIKKWSK